MVGNFRNFLHQIHQENIERQRFLIEEELMNWKGNLEQVDDILVMGFKI